MGIGPGGRSRTPTFAYPEIWPKFTVSGVCQDHTPQYIVVGVLTADPPRISSAIAAAARCQGGAGRPERGDGASGVPPCQRRRVEPPVHHASWTRGQGIGKRGSGDDASCPTQAGRGPVGRSEMIERESASAQRRGARQQRKAAAQGAHRPPVLHHAGRRPGRGAGLGDPHRRHHRRGRQGHLRAEGRRGPEELVAARHQRGRVQVLPRRSRARPQRETLGPPAGRPRGQHHRRLGAQGRLLRHRGRRRRPSRPSSPTSSTGRR